MGLFDLLDWLDNTNPMWRDYEFRRIDDDLMEELLFQFFRDNPEWLDDTTPPCVPNGAEWVSALFVSSGPAVKEAKWCIFGYCQKALVDDLVHKESLELTYG